MKFKGGQHGKNQDILVDQRVFVSVDAHKKTFSVALLRPDGMVKDWPSLADVAPLTKILSSLPVLIGAVSTKLGQQGLDWPEVSRLSGFV